ncbi:3'5'-cyclic nucleotide phosphodiesterase [Haematococcus lacustris]|uniref:3'5'-cyclic nucleotide phosphodiesterase n=1 Tax=Haematococcus lacustris TaxID=44745 RepID=A0A699Z5L9_HAELA|nr:3'5'-cyclic nucleotide phosphodiesterase [Haematococcus lacustris]
MENHHLAAAFSLLKDPELNFLALLPKASWERLRKLMVELVLGTDLPSYGKASSSTVDELQPVSEQDKLLSLQASPQLTQ